MRHVAAAATVAAVVLSLPHWWWRRRQRSSAAAHVLPLARPGGQGGRPAFLRATAQFQYSKVVPIKAEITAKLEEQRRLHRDVTNLQIGRDVEYEDDWDFPDRQGTEDAKEADDDDGGGAGA